VNFLDIVLVFSLAASLSLPGAYTIVGAAFAVIGLVSLLKRLQSGVPWMEPDLTGKLPLFFIAFAFISAAIQSYHQVPASGYEIYIPFLWAPLIMLAVLDGGIDRRYLWLGCMFGAIFACLLAVYQTIHLGYDRADGFSGSPITFGNNALLLGSIALVGRRDSLLNVSKSVWFGFSYFSFLAGLAASMITQSKGGWLLIPVVLVWFLVEDFSRISRGLKITFSMAAIAIICVLPFTPLKKNIDRIEEAGSSTAQWFQTGQITDLSATPRLALWKFGWTIWPEKPWLGHGRDGIVQRMSDMTAEKKLDPQIAGYGLRVLHNEPLQLLAEQGIIGLLGWAMMFAATFFVFVRSYLQKDRVQKILGQAGLITVTASLIFGLSDMNLMLNANRQMFVFLVMTTAALVISEKKRVTSA